jgi:hypothetical protein
MPAGIAKRPNNINPGKIIYIKRPRLVLPLSNMDEMKNRIIMSRRLMPAMIEPIIVSQFLDDDGSFIGLGYFCAFELDYH